MSPLSLNRSDILAILTAPDARDIFSMARDLRDRVHGREVHVRAIIETSNHCRVDCHYCGLRRSNRQAPRYRMSLTDVVNTAREAIAAGFESVVLQSGEDASVSDAALADMTSQIRMVSPSAGLTLSFGERSPDVYARWFRAGADRYLMKFETSNPTLFARLRPDRNLDGRLACLRSIREAGLQMGTGFMVGLPGQTIDDMASDLLLLRDLDPDMAGIGPFIPHPATPLASSEVEMLPNRVELTLRAIAVGRLLCPRTHLPATTALGTMAPDGWKRALECGANVLMKDVTPPTLSAAYDIYPGRPASRPTAREGFELLRDIADSAGLTIARGPGHAVRVNTSRTDP